MDVIKVAAKGRDPWNKCKLVGQKSPLKLKEIWAIRIRLQTRFADSRSCTVQFWRSTASSGPAIWSNCGFAMSRTASGSADVPQSCSRRRNGPFSLRSRNQREMPSVTGSVTSVSDLKTTCFRPAYTVHPTCPHGITLESSTGGSGR